MGGIRVHAFDHITDFYAAQVTTSTDGTFTLQGLYPAEFNVSAGENGYIQEWFDGAFGDGSPSSADAVPVPVSFGNMPTNIDFFLSEGALLCVCVSNLYGEPIEGAWVSMRQGEPSPLVYLSSGNTDENGQYERRGIMQPQLRVSVDANGYESRETDVSLTHGATSIVHFALSERPAEALAPEVRQGNLTVTWTVPPRGAYRIECSSNLTDWIQAHEGEAVDQKNERLGNPSLWIEYRKPFAPFEERDFYRLRKLP